MRKVFVTLLVAMLVSSIAIAAEFSPTLMKLTADPVIQYDFDGSKLDIPVTVEGHSAGIIFSVYTKGKANEIGIVNNGYLGWHWVNKIDTCIYYSPLQSAGIGTTNISWDGKDQDGGQVPEGEYSYYLWAFDNQGVKEQMSQFLPSGWGFDYTAAIQEVDEAGLPMANPIWYRANQRWNVGSDPFDESLMITTNISYAEGWGNAGLPQLDPTDFDMMYLSVGNTEAKQRSIQKFKFVPGGDAELQTDWGEADGYATTFSTAGGGSPGIATNGTYLYTGDENHVASTEPDSDFYIYDMDGYMLETVDLTPWWSNPDELEAGGQMNGGPNNWDIRDGYVYLNCHCNCLNQMVDPVRYMETEEYDDFFVWSNDNGDYTGDHNFEETAQLPWVCNDYNVGPYKYSISPDKYRFTAINAYDVGAVSFALMAPDGTGLGYYAFAGETAGWKKGVIFIQSGTPFDGLYCDNEQTMGPHYDSNADLREPGIFFLGHDSIMGTITTAVSVEEDAPAAFSVAQNSPNPFNPTTTINFSLAQAGDVSVDVFNVAGQKVDTLVEGYMNAGSQSVVWDASDFSAGVYFYTVKTAGFSKTMKMTLLK